jgi:hypothetical protein
MTGDIQSSNNSAYRSWNGAYNTAILKADYLQLGNSNIGGNTLTVEWDGITFADGKQTVKYPGASILTGYATESWVTAGFYPLSGNPSGFLTASALTPYLTTADAATTYQTLAGMSSYLTTSAAASTYYLQTNPSFFINQTTADGLYYPLSGNPSGFLTASALTPYAELAGAAFTGPVSTSDTVTVGSFNPDPTPTANGQIWFNLLLGKLRFYDSISTKSVASEAWASAAFYPLSLNPAGYATLASPTFTGNPTAPTPATSDNDTSIATTAYVKAQPFGDRYLTTSTTSNAISNGNKTFTIGTGLSYTPTQSITISYDAAKHMHGEVLTYDSGTGVLTVDINHHTGSGTYAAWVVNVGGVVPATSVAFADITGAVSGNANLQAALDLKSNLASPTFTGTPTLPTGTIATTQSPGNNTTALATTAFVTAAVPAFATFDTPGVNSTTTIVSPRIAIDYLMHPGRTEWLKFGSSATSGTGAAVFGGNTTGLTYRWNQMYSPNVSTAGYGMAIWDTADSGLGMLGFTRGQTYESRAWNKGIWASGRGVVGGSNNTFNGDANCTVRVSVGGKSAAGSGAIDITNPGFGWLIPGMGNAMQLQVSKGDSSALTTVTSSFTPVARQVFDWKMFSDGTGNVTLWINDNVVATTTAGPSTATAESYNFYFEMVEQTASAATRIVYNSFNSRVWWGV